MKTKQNTLDGYHFIRLKQVDKDSVTAVGNHLMYLDFTSSFSPEDYFDAEQEVRYSKSQLKQLYKNDTIETIYRYYGQSTGFNRVKRP